MIYKNGKIEETKNADLFKRFKEEYSVHLTEVNKVVTIKPENPIKIRYVDSLIVPNPHNPRTPDFPRSIALSLRAMVPTKDGMAEYRYSSSPGIVDPSANGQLKFTETQIAVRREMTITDIDLAFWFVAYSNQNADAYVQTPGNSKYFIVNDEKKTISAKALKNRLKARLENRLWEDEDNGGLSLSELTVIANTMMIPNISNMDDIDQIRNAVDGQIKADKTGKVSEQFLLMSDKLTESDKKNSEVKGLIQRALDKGIICQNHKERRFFKKGEDPTKNAIYDYRSAEGEPKIALFHYLSNHQPALIEWLKVELEKTSESVMA